MYNEAVNKYNSGNLDEAENIANNLLKSDPKDSQSLYLLGLIYQKKKNIKRSVEYLHKSVEIHETLNNLFAYANVLILAAKYHESIDCYKKILLINSLHEPTMVNLSYAYFLIHDYVNTERCLLEALKLNKNNPYTYKNLGDLYRRQNKYNKALDNYNIAFEFDRKNSEIKKGIALLYLEQKKYKKGWELYDSRLFCRQNLGTTFALVKNNLFFDSLNNNMKIAVISEQGLGDNILFSSMYADLINLNKNLKFITDLRLIEIFKRSFGNFEFIEKNDSKSIKKLIDGEYKFIYSGSLGRHFRTSLDDFDGKPFLVPDPNKVIKYKSLLSKYGFKKFVGISWKSITKGHGAKSINLEKFTPLLNDETIGFINLQYGDVQDIEKYNLNNKIIKIQNLDLYHDIDDVIALIDCLDLVITTPNVNVHFAGSVGKKCIVLSPLYNELFLYSALNDGKCEWYGSQHTIVVDDNIESEIIKIKNLL